MTSTSTEIREQLLREFDSLAFARAEFPMLTDWGVIDESVAVHSLGYNYLANLGRRLGYWAATEYPIRVGRSFVRPDVVWWCKASKRLVLIGEFERFDAGQNEKLSDKSKNLLLSYEALGRTAETLLLMPWTTAGTNLSGNHTATSVAYEGFRADDGTMIRGIGQEATFILAHAVFGRSQNVCRLLEVQV